MDLPSWNLDEVFTAAALLAETKLSRD